MTPDQLAAFFRQLEASSTALVGEMLRPVYESTVDMLLPFWPYALGVFFLLLFGASIQFARGRWGPMGSLLYNTFYFGFLGILLAIWGVDLLLNPYFDLIYGLLYPISYLLTGMMLRRAGAKI